MEVDRYEEVENEGEINRFRETEKFYRVPAVIKRKKTKKTDFSGVIDFTFQENNSEENKKLIQKMEINTEIQNSLDPIVPRIQNAYTISNLPGFIFIPNPLSEEQQRYWVKRAVLDFPINNPTNVSNLKKTPLWEEWNPEHMEPLRWATLGYHFQWTPRKYLEEFKGPFPQDLHTFSTGIANQLNFEINPQAGTVNYYPVPKQMMGGHLDDAEDDLTKPIVSASYGNTVVFLIGGKTRAEVPTALWIRSGDIVIMGGHSRYCYHGVPRMIENTCPSFLCSDEQNPVDSYIKNSRINMNVRQVRVQQS